MTSAHRLVDLHVRDDTVYISHGSAVLATQRDGFLHDGVEHGLFVDQTRLLSRYVCRVDGKPPLPVTLSNVDQDSWLGYYLVIPTDREHASLLAPDSLAQRGLELRVSRVLGDGLHEDFDLANYTGQPMRFRLSLEIDADFADQEETRLGRQQYGELRREWRQDDNAHELLLDYRAEHHYDQQGHRGVERLHRSVIVRVVGADSAPALRDNRIEFDIDLPPLARWHACLLWIPRIEGREGAPPAGCRAFVRAPPADNDPEAVFPGEATAFESAHTDTLAPIVLDALAQARCDLLALRLARFDRGPRAWTVAAGLPMYVALFGRDMLTVAWEAALLGPELLRGMLPVLAELQGTQVDDWRDEDPGRMLHEAHSGPLEQLHFNPKGRYYGAHTTSAFYPFVVAQLWHWTGDRAAVQPLIEPALKTLQWLEHCIRRLPECFSGHPRDAEHPFPALYPAANSPQAWSASTVFTLLQAMLGLYPYAPYRLLFVDPHLPAWLPEITLRGLRVGDAVVSLHCFRKPDGGTDYRVREQHGRLHVIRQPSPWSLTANYGERLKDLLLSALPGR